MMTLTHGDSMVSSSFMQHRRRSRSSRLSSKMFSPNGRQHPLDLAEDALDGGARRLHQYFVSMVLKAANTPR